MLSAAQCTRPTVAPRNTGSFVTSPRWFQSLLSFSCCSTLSSSVYLQSFLPCQIHDVYKVSHMRLYHYFFALTVTKVYSINVKGLLQKIGIRVIRVAFYATESFHLHDGYRMNEVLYWYGYNWYWYWYCNFLNDTQPSGDGLYLMSRLQCWICCVLWWSNYAMVTLILNDLKHILFLDSEFLFSANKLAQLINCPALVSCNNSFRYEQQQVQLWDVGRCILLTICITRDTREVYTVISKLGKLYFTNQKRE